MAKCPKIILSADGTISGVAQQLSSRPTNSSGIRPKAESAKNTALLTTSACRLPLFLVITLSESPAFRFLFQPLVRGTPTQVTCYDVMFLSFSLHFFKFLF